MLAVGRERARRRVGSLLNPRTTEEQAEIEDRIIFTEANAEALPFADRSIDAVTIAFGIRNVSTTSTSRSRRASAETSSACLATKSNARKSA